MALTWSRKTTAESEGSIIDSCRNRSILTSKEGFTHDSQFYHTRQEVVRFQPYRATAALSAVKTSYQLLMMQWDRHDFSCSWERTTIFHESHVKQLATRSSILSFGLHARRIHHLRDGPPILFISDNFSKCSASSLWTEMSRSTYHQGHANKVMLVIYHQDFSWNVQIFNNKASAVGYSTKFKTSFKSPSSIWTPCSVYSLWFTTNHTRSAVRNDVNGNGFQWIHW